MNRERQREVTIHACMHTHIQLVRSTVEIPCNNNIRISREGERERERTKNSCGYEKKNLSLASQNDSLLKHRSVGSFCLIFIVQNPHT